VEKKDSRDLELNDVEHLLPTLNEKTRVSAVNGGTIDVAAVVSGGAGGGDAIHHSAGLTTPKLVASYPFGFAVNINVATTESFWSKCNLGARGVVVTFYHDGTNAYTSDPSIDVTIPAGVPSGRLKVHGSRCASGTISIENEHAVGPSEFSGGLFDTEDTTVVVSDSQNTYWTWSDSSGNEGFNYHKRITKSVSAVSLTTVTLSLTNAAAELRQFSVLIDFEYVPDNVVLYDLLTYNVDIAHTDPVAMAIDVLFRYATYCSENNITTFIDTLNSRLGTSYDENIIYPQNWNTSAFENPRRFFQEFIRLYHEYREMILMDIRFLSEI